MIDRPGATVEARPPQLLGSRAPHALPLFLAALAVVFLASVYPRIAQYEDWLESPERFFSRGVPVAGTDSYLFFRYAKEYERGQAPGDRDRLRNFPDGGERLPTPALSTAMVAISRWTGLDIYRAGLWITIVSSSLFVFPLGVYCFRLESPLSGIWGALVGSFGTNYYLRTAVHRVDTDGGNLFFLWLVSLLVLEVGLRSEQRRARLATAALAGLCLQAFCVWYAQPGFVAVFVGSLVVYLFARRTDTRTLLLLSAVVVLFADPSLLHRASLDLQEFLQRYVLARGNDPAALRGGLLFPSILGEIAELRRLPLLESLGQATGHPAVGVLGLVGFVLFALGRPIEAIPLLPLLALAVLGLVSAQRFLMYLGPFLGIGCGWLITSMLRGVWRRIGVLATLPPARSSSVALLVGVAPLAVLLPATTFFAIPQPTIPLELLASLQRMGDRLPAETAIVHTWGHGYLVTALTGAATFNDGFDPDPVVEQLVDRGLTDADPAVLHDLTSFIATLGRRGIDAAIERESSYPGLLRSAKGSEPPAEVRLFVLLTGEMVIRFGDLWQKGRWNFDTKSGSREGYDVRHCVPIRAGLRCSKPGKPDLSVDLEQGRVNARAPLARFVRVVAGRVVEERSYPHPGGIWMQLLESDAGEPHTLHILRPEVFESNFNQMYALARFDPERFRLVFDEFPVARLYQVLPALVPPATAKSR